MTDIKIPKSWKELESENAQLRAARDKLSEEVDSLTEEVEKQGDANVRLASELEEARKVIEKVAAYWNNENARDYACEWLAAHPEKKP